MDKVEKYAAAICIVIFAICAACILGCKPKEIILSDKLMSDTTIIAQRVEYRDTAIIVEADSAAIMALVPGCPDIPAQRTSNGRVRLQVQIKDGMLKADCLCLEQIKRLKIATFYNSLTRKALDKQHNTRLITTNRVPGFVKFLAWTGGILLAGMLIYIVIKIVIKIYKPI